jgi:dynein heavy chain
MSDNRLEFVKDLVVGGIGVAQDDFDLALTREGADQPGKDLVGGGKEADGPQYVLNAFWATASCETVLYFYEAMAEIATEIEEETEVPVQKAAPAEGDEVPTDATLEAPEEGKEGVEAEADADAEAEAEAPPAIEMEIKMVKRTVYHSERRMFASYEMPTNTKILGNSCYLMKLRHLAGGPSMKIEDIQKSIEFGILPGHILQTMSMAIGEVYMPLLEDAASRIKKESTEEGKTNSKQVEFRSNMQRFSGHISHALQQVKEDQHLSIPNIIITNPEEQALDTAIVNQLDEALEDWCRTISNVVEEEACKAPRSTGPLAEIEFWRQRNTALCALCEKLNMPNVQAMLKVLEICDSPLMQVRALCFLGILLTYLISVVA